MKAMGSLTALVDGEWRIVDDPPVVTHVEIPGGAAALARTFSDYCATLAENRRELVERYRFVDVALKVVGVGSVGTRCFVVLLQGRAPGARKPDTSPRAAPTTEDFLDGRERNLLSLQKPPRGFAPARSPRLRREPRAFSPHRRCRPSV